MVVSSFERIDGTPVVGADAQKRNAWSTARRLQVATSPLRGPLPTTPTHLFSADAMGGKKGATQALKGRQGGSTLPCMIAIACHNVDDEKTARTIRSPHAPSPLILLLVLQLLAIAAVACVTLIAAPMLSSVVDSGPVSLAAPGGNVDSLSSSILGGLEKAMDSSVDTKVKAVLKSPAAREQALSQLPAAAASSAAAPKAAREQQLMLQQPYHRAMPVTAAAGYHRLLPFDPHPYVTQTQLDR
jgi:hypothetical protein